jgi:hypothetical protein
VPSASTVDHGAAGVAELRVIVAPSPTQAVAELSTAN